MSCPGTLLCPALLFFGPCSASLPRLGCLGGWLCPHLCGSSGVLAGRRLAETPAAALRKQSVTKDESRYSNQDTTVEAVQNSFQNPASKKVLLLPDLLRQAQCNQCKDQ